MNIWGSVLGLEHETRLQVAVGKTPYVMKGVNARMAKGPSYI